MKRNVVLAISALVVSLLAWRWARHEDAPAPRTGQTAQAPTSEAIAPELVRPARELAATPQDDSLRTAPARTASEQPTVTKDDSVATLPPLRAPIIQAIRAGGQTPQEKRASMLRAIETSGASQEAWTERAQRSFDGWRGAIPESARRGLRMGPVACFRAGCVVEVSFASEAAYQEAARAFRTISEREASHGGRVQTPPDAQSGKIVANWIMLRPESVPEEDDA
jgi:hypothetical protein